MKTKNISLRINLDPEKVRLNLVSGRRVIDSAGFSYYRDLEDKLTPLEASYLRRYGYIKMGGGRVYDELLTGLITGLDKLLKRNRMGTHHLKSYRISENIGENATSYKIVRAFIAGLKVKV